jgi:Uma2 family endonuclease
MNFRQKVSVEDYQKMGAAGLIGKDTELLDGVICKKPRKSPMECVVTSRLLEVISPLEAEGYLVRTFGPITCGEHSEPEPNVSVVRGALDDFLREHPKMAELVIEVSDKTHEFDRMKLRAYATANVRDCWLVLIPERQIEVHRNPLSGEYLEKTIVSPGEEIQGLASSSLRVDLQRLFRE